MMKIGTTQAEQGTFAGVGWRPTGGRFGKVSAKPTFSRQWNRFTLRTMLGGVALASVLLTVVAVLMQKEVMQRRAVADLLQFDGASVFALYGEYEYARPPIFALGNGLSLVLKHGQRLHGFAVDDEPSQLERLLVPIFGQHAFTEVSAVFWDGALVNDTDLRLLASVPQLRELHIGGTSVTDAGVEQILRLQNLAVLDLSDTSMTNNGLRRLTACSNLRELDLGGTQIDDAIARQLEQALPDCDIAW